MRFFGFPGEEGRAQALAAACGGEAGALNFRRRPDRESGFRLDPVPAGEEAVLVCGLDDPDPKLAGVLMAADTARELGAVRVGLAASYLAYMRQDARFAPGEPESARLLASLLSSRFDWLVTIDPHLHRIRSLAEIYDIPTVAASAADAVAEWIGGRTPDPLIVGPDSESAQWARKIADRLDAPFVTLSKTRLGDRAVRIAGPDLSAHLGRAPVLVDDIVSSGRTMLEGAKALAAAGFGKPICIAIHALFSPRAQADLAPWVECIVSTDSVRHETNAISVDPALAQAIRSVRGG